MPAGEYSTLDQTGRWGMRKGGPPTRGSFNFVNDATQPEPMTMPDFESHNFKF